MKNVIYYGLVLSALWLVGVPTLAQNGTAAGDETQAPQTPLYEIQPNDILEVFVWKEPELSRKVIVRPDGRISVPLVQDMVAAGLTPTELKMQIELRLKDFITSPSVTVIVDTIQHYKIYVTGKVQKPGVFTATEPVTVLQALSLAGGFQDYADKSAISVVRTVDREHVTTAFNYGDVIRGKSPQQNILLRSGDVVVVP